MSNKEILDTLRVARRTLESLPPVKILSDWTWRDDVRRWILHCQIWVESARRELIPEVTEWYVLVASEYPWGHIEFYPSKRNGLTRTFPHQNFNSEGNDNYPWRNGNLCLSTSSRAFGRHTLDIEPYDVHWRLHWHFERAIQWLSAGSQGMLASQDEQFELPHFPVNSSATVIFSEGIESFAKWQVISDSAGLLDLVPLSHDSDILFVKSFRSARGHELFVPTWGRIMTELNAEKVSGIWVHLKTVPVLEPWQVPLNWKDLRDICREQKIELDHELKKIVRAIRDGKHHLLVLGFPIPSKVGDSPCQMHWQPIELPVLSKGSKTARGFRTNDLGYWQRDRTEILRGTMILPWGDSENWHSEQISTRGKFTDMIASRQVLLIGVGAIGSVVAELLIRGNVRRLVLVDSDKLEIGNLSRHTLTRDSLKESKAACVAQRLNLASPHAIVESIECDFPFVDETHGSSIQECDLVLDCTGSDSVLHHLEHFAWNNEKVFVSLSLGRSGRRLFCFTALGKSFSYSAFSDSVKPWLEKERNEYKDQPLPWSGIGCWHPIFPARVDDVWMMASIAVKHIESLMTFHSIRENFAVFEQVYDMNGNFCGVHRVENNEAGH